MCVSLFVYIVSSILTPSPLIKKKKSKTKIRSVGEKYLNRHKHRCIKNPCGEKLPADWKE
jgi:hypothetical protein